MQPVRFFWILLLILLLITILFFSSHFSMLYKVVEIMTNEHVSPSPCIIYNFNKNYISVVHTHVDTFLCALRSYLYIIVEFNPSGTKFMVESIRPSTFARIIYARAIAAWWRPQYVSWLLLPGYESYLSVKAHFTKRIIEQCYVNINLFINWQFK